MHDVLDATPPPASVAPTRNNLRTRHFAKLLRSRALGQLIIQLTDRCNAACPQCDMRMSSDFQRSVLPIDVARRSIDHVAANGVVALSITGGELLLYLKEVTSLLRHACDAGIPLTRTGTNGFLFQNSDKPSFESRVARIAENL